MENNEQVVKQKSNKGVIIVLIILVLGLCTYIAYDKFVLDKDIKTNEVTQTNVKEESKNDNTTVEVKKEEVPITDKSAFIISVSNDSANYLYCYIKDGILYYSGDNKSNDGQNKYFDVLGASYSNNDNNYIPIKEETLTNIKRIKVFNEGTSVNPRLYALTEDGKVYSTSTYTGIDFKQVNDLKDYQVDDLLDYKFADQPEADYKVILKDGTTKDIHVTY